MLGALDGFQVIAEADSDEAAVDAARRERPDLAVIEPELSGCGGWWAIQQVSREQLARAVVAIGRSADGLLARQAGAHGYVQMGSSMRDLLAELRSAVASFEQRRSGTEAERKLLPDAHTVLGKPALVDF